MLRWLLIFDSACISPALSFHITFQSPLILNYFIRNDTLFSPLVFIPRNTMCYICGFISCSQFQEV